MLREIGSVRQEEPGLRRRWFRDEYFDLYLWEGGAGEVRAFQLCYDRSHRERSLRWSHKTGFLHEGVNNPETKPGRAMSAILVIAGHLPVAAVSRRLLHASQELPPAMRDFIFEKLGEYAHAVAKPAKPPRKPTARKPARKQSRPRGRR
jgi:hypothetical protein